MAQKRSYRSDIIRFAFLFIALAVFFAGPKFMETDSTSGIDDTIESVKKSKHISKELRMEVLEQLVKDKKFAQQNANLVSVATVKLPAVYWLALLIIILGLGAPLIMKYFENKKAQQ